MATESFGGLTLAIARGVGRLRIDYPPLNLMGGPFSADLAAALPRIIGDESIRVLILESAVPGVFCLHGDASGMPATQAYVRSDGESARQMFATVHALLGRFAEMPQIVIAKIAGLCRGGGMELALAADMRFAATGVTRMGQPEVAMGLVPGAGGTTRLPRLVGRARALEVLLGSADLTAEDAERLGVINRALPPERLDAHVDRLAKHIADLPPYAVRAAKRAVEALTGPLDFGPELDAVLATFGHVDFPRHVNGVLKAGLQRSLADEWDIDALTAEGRRIAREELEADRGG